MTDYRDLLTRARNALEKFAPTSQADLLDEIDAALAEPDEGWMPIDPNADMSAAPWDGKPVLICTNHDRSYRNPVHRAIWTDAIHGAGIFGWAIEDYKFGPYPLRGYTVVTHWRPLPKPPVQP